MNTSVLSSLFFTADSVVRGAPWWRHENLVSPAGALSRTFGLPSETQCLGPLECRWHEDLFLGPWTPFSTAFLAFKDFALPLGGAGDSFSVKGETSALYTELPFMVPCSQRPCHDMDHGVWRWKHVVVGEGGGLTWMEAEASLWETLPALESKNLDDANLTNIRLTRKCSCLRSPWNPANTNLIHQRSNWLFWW